MARLTAIAFGAVLSISTLCNGAELTLHDQSHFRRPVAVAVANDGNTLLVANRHSGSLSVIDVQAQVVTQEVPIGEQLAGLSISEDQHLLAIVDDRASELVLLGLEEGQIHEESRFAVSTAPVSVTFSADGSRLFVASLWSRRLTAVDIADRSKPTIRQVIDLPFAPREQLLLADGETLLVADAFGGRLAFVDTKHGKLQGVRTIVGHNIGGVALSRDGSRLFVPHPILHSEETTTHDGVHWGGVLSNVVRDVSVAELISKNSGPLSEVGALFYLGYPDDATGDPTGISVLADGRQIIAYAGISQIAISDHGVNYYKRVNVGRRPTAFALSPDEKQLYVANKYSDSISVVDVNAAKLVAEISLGPHPKPTLAEEGEMLFHDATLSSDGWYSCHSCHTEGHTNGGLNDNFGDDSYGAPKRVLSLLGVSRTGPWAWNGSVDNLEKQVRKSIETTMQGPPPTDRQVNALAAYLRTLEPAPSLAAARNEWDQPSIERGKALFARLNCADCHASPHYTSAGAYDVGLQDEHGHKEFNPPTLRGVSQLDRLFHDNRSGSLHETFAKFQHGLDQSLSGEELADLIAFLRSL